jgi:hypothetical protein
MGRRGEWERSNGWRGRDGTDCTAALHTAKVQLPPLRSTNIGCYIRDSLSNFIIEIVDVGKAVRSIPCFTKEGLVAIKFLPLYVREYPTKIAQQGNLSNSPEPVTQVAATNCFGWRDTNSKRRLNAERIGVTHVFHKFSLTK